MNMNEHDKKSLDVNNVQEHYHHQYSYHRVNTFDPNLGTAASRYSPPQYCEENGLSDCPNGTYGNVILIPNSGSIMAHENGLLSVAEAAQTIESGILDQYNILPTDHRIITYVRTLNDVNADQVYESQQHQLLENSDELKNYQSSHHHQQHDDSDSFVHHQNLTDETGGTTQIIFRRSPNGRMYQQIHNFILNTDGNNIDSNSLSVNNDSTGGNVVTEQHSMVDEIQEAFAPYDTTASSNMAGHQNNEMIVVPNDDRIGLYFNNGLPYDDHHHHNQTNLLIEPNPSDGYLPIDNTNGNLSEHQQRAINDNCSQTNGMVNVVMPAIEDKDQLLEMTMSPLLAAINDITNKNRNWPPVSPPGVKSESIKQIDRSTANEMHYYNTDMATGVTTTGEITINQPTVTNSVANNNYKIINIRSSLSDEYVDINDVKTIQLVQHLENNADDERDSIDDYDNDNDEGLNDEDEANYNMDELQGVRRSKRMKKPETFLMVADKHVPCRAWASLPTSYLYIAKLPNSPNEYTVYSKKDIPLRTKFGPFEGDFRDIVEDDLNKLKCQPVEYPLLLVSDKYLDVSNENTSNWMRFVRFAESYLQQNVLLFETDGKLYLKSSQFIRAKQELRVGYSREYAEKYQLPLLKSSHQPDESVVENSSDYWPCFECDKKYKSSEDLQKHLDCDHESDVVNKVTRRKRHVKRKGSSRYSCPVCSKTFFKNINFRRHLKNHSGNPLLEKHLSDSDSNKLVNSSSSSGTSVQKTSGKVGDKKIERKKSNVKNKENNQFKCGLCSKSFLNDERLKRHCLVHGPSELKPYQCHYCTKRFLNGSAMAAHVKVHLFGKFYFQCQLCNERFKQNPEFMAHVKIHMIDNSHYLCKFCNKKFAEYVQIRKHIRAFHPAVKLPCTICDKKFSNTEKLRVHMLIHSDKKDFLCSVCGKQFKRKDKLKEHIKRIHTIKNTTAKSDVSAVARATTTTLGQQPSMEHNKNLIAAAADLICDNKLADDDGLLDNNNDGVDFVVEDGGGGGEEEDEKFNKKKKTKFLPKVSPNDYQRFIYKCHDCLLGFKRRGMLVNHLAKRHPDIRIDSVPELNLPILKAQKFFYCQYCNKVYRSSGKRKYHILKCHPGSELPMSGRQKGGAENNGYPTYSETVSTITTHPHLCDWCHKQYASKPKLVEHQRKKHSDKLDKLNVKIKSICYQSSGPNEDQYATTVDDSYKECGTDKYHPNGVNYDINSTSHYNGNTIRESPLSVSATLPIEENKEHHHQHQHHQISGNNSTIPQSDYQTIFDYMDYINLKPVPIIGQPSAPSTSCLMEDSKKITTYCYSENGG